MQKTIDKLKWFFIERKRDYIIAILSLIIVNVIVVIPPHYVGKAVDRIHQGDISHSELMYYITLLCFLALSDFGFSFLWIYKLFNNAILLQRDLRRKLMDKLLRMTPAFYEKNLTGDLMAKATNDLNAVSEMAGFGVLALTDATVFMGTIIFMMGQFISWKLTLMSLIPLPLLAIGSKYVGDFIHQKYLVAQNTFGKMNDTVLEYIVGVRVVRSYVRERFTERQFDQMTQEVFEKNMKVEVWSGLFIPSVKIMSAISYTITVTYGAQLILEGSNTLGELISFNVYLSYILWPMMAIGEFMNTMQRGTASLERVMETIDYPEDVIAHADDQPVAGIENIQLSGYSFTYPKSIAVNLKQIDLTLHRGETLGIVGKTGSGKTTLVRQILREYPKGSGELFISGTDIARTEKDSLLRLIGYVPQDHVLFSRSIRENILFGREDATEIEVMEAIRTADFEKDLFLLPNGLETLIGERGISISGGQKQRLSIARAVIRNPELLILDDSLSAVDAKTESRIIENIRRNRQGKTTMITTHRLSAIQHADQIIVLEDGEITERGTHQELMEKNGWYRQQFDIQKLEEVVF